MQLATGVLPPCSCRVYCCHVKIPGPFTMLESLACWFVLYNSICSLDWRRPFNSEQCVHISTSLVCLPKATWNKSSTFSNHTWFYSPKLVVVNCDWNMWSETSSAPVSVWMMLAGTRYSNDMNDATRNQDLSSNGGGGRWGAGQPRRATVGRREAAWPACAQCRAGKQARRTRWIEK